MVKSAGVNDKKAAMPAVRGSVHAGEVHESGAAKVEDRADEKAAAAAVPRPNRIYKNIVVDEVKDKRSLGMILQEWVKEKKLKTGVRWSTMTDAEIKTMTTVARANALGVPYAYAKQVIV